MAKIIDTHSHILPGIDDGAGSWKEALCMLKTAQAQGIRRVIATPHWGGPFGYTDPVQIRELCFTLQEKGKRLIFRYDRKNPRLLFSSRSTLTVHI